MELDRQEVEGLVAHRVEEDGVAGEVLAYLGCLPDPFSQDPMALRSLDRGRNWGQIGVRLANLQVWISLSAIDGQSCKFASLTPEHLAISRLSVSLR